MVPGMPLRYVDPNQKHGRMYRADVRLGRSRAGQLLGRYVNSRIDPWLYRATGGRYPAFLPVVASAPLMTTGAKHPILIASNYGEAKHPQWYYNLKAYPGCQFGDQRFVATEVTDPDEYARLYGLGEQVYAGYGDYRVKTTAIGRRIPIFRLGPNKDVPDKTG